MQIVQLGLFTAAFCGKTVITMSQRPKALVYRGPAACDECPEAVAALLESSPQSFNVSFAGPNEAIDISDETLQGIEVYAFPGGPDLDSAYASTMHYTGPLQAFVSAGGHYLGFCLGAYLAGHSPGYGLLPAHADADSEIENPASQVYDDDSDTIIQVDWTLSDGTTKSNAWAYFQEGAYMTGLENLSESEGRVLARYSKSRDVVASVTKLGKGWVGLVGVHPEADESWYADECLTNPDGISFEFGYDLIAATLNSGKTE